LVTRYWLIDNDSNYNIQLLGCNASLPISDLTTSHK